MYYKKPYYGFVAPGIAAVFTDWKEVERMAMVYPYCSYRKRFSEKAAWDWVNSRHISNKIKDIVKYGDIFKEHYVTIEYIIGSDSVYYNVYKNKMPDLKIVSDNQNVLVENRAQTVMVRLMGLTLNPDLIKSHIIAIYQILNILGGFIDVDLILPNHSVYLALSQYSGTDVGIRRVQDYIQHKRLGHVAYTVRDYYLLGGDDDEEIYQYDY